MRDEPLSPPLSSVGLRRREAILSAALLAARRVRRRRSIRRVAVTTVLPLAAMLGGVVIVATARHRQSNPPRPIAMPAPIAPTPTQLPTPAPMPVTPRPQLVDGRPTRVVASSNAAVICVVGDAPNIRARFATPAVSASSIRRVDDQALLHTLDASGLQAGLATVGDTTLLYVDGQAVR